MNFREFHTSGYFGEQGQEKEELIPAERAAPTSYTYVLMTSSFPAPLPFSGQRKRKLGRSDSIRPMGQKKDHEFNVRWLKAARRVLKPDGTLWVTGTPHHL